jgi:hypothetical protein
MMHQHRLNPNSNNEKTYICMFVCARILLYLYVNLIHFFTNLLANLNFPFCKFVYKFVNFDGLWKGDIYLFILSTSFSFVMDG